MPDDRVVQSLDELYAVALEHHMAGREDQAEQLYLSILSVPPIQAEACYNLGLLYQTRGLVVQALAAYGRAVALRRDYVEAYCNAATALRGLGQPEEAIADDLRNRQ